LKNVALHIENVTDYFVELVAELSHTAALRFCLVLFYNFPAVPNRATSRIPLILTLDIRVGIHASPQPTVLPPLAVIYHD